MTTSPDWRGALDSLGAAAAAAGVQADGGILQSIANQVGILGYQYDQDFAYYSRALAALAVSPVPALYAAFQSYRAQFGWCAGIVTEQGGSPPAYDTSLATLILMQIAMNAAIASLNGDDQAAAIGALASLLQMQSQLGSAPQPPAPVQPQPPNASPLLGAMQRASRYAAFLRGA